MEQGHLFKKYGLPIINVNPGNVKFNLTKNKVLIVADPSIEWKQPL